MTGNIPVEQIKALAEDVRLIKDFSENHNFDASLLKPNVSPLEKSPAKKDLPLICMIVSIISLILSIAAIRFWKPPFDQAQSGFVFIIGLVFLILASMATHMKFKDTTVTVIAVIGLLMVLFIGAGVFSPEQAIDKVGEFAGH